ncbi:DNA-methyltransferase [Neomicrococcus lactis]|uniref:DNA-methyltransferase n=1 Tax=Neomicrococcus lactis TaxID=732241 RepID=UPI002300AFA1|nr:site-specific DNA-methyltransferase [Neomicrococcus lactis]
MDPASPTEGTPVQLIIHGDNADVLPLFPDEVAQVIYVDPPFNTGRAQVRQEVKTVRTKPGEGDRRGFKGKEYATVLGALHRYDDSFADYWEFLEPRMREAWRLLAPTGTLYVHLDYREAHYVKVMLDMIFGRECFLNEIIWAYDYGARSKSRWPAKHDTILVYVKDPKNYHFDASAVDREPYMAPGLVTPEKAALGKLPTDVWWHTIVSPTGKEKTGYPTQKPLGVLRRIISASSRPGDLVLDFFAGSGTTGAAAAELGRGFALLDQNPAAVSVMTSRIPSASVMVASEYDDAGLRAAVAELLGSPADSDDVASDVEAVSADADAVASSTEL